MFYGETKRRLTISLDKPLKEKTKEIFEEMWKYYNAGWTPKPKYGKRCRRRSLYDLCLPKMNGNGTVDKYIERMIEEE